MNRIGFIADLSENINNNKITPNKSIDKLLEILDKKCEESSICFDEISQLDEEKIKDNVKNCIAIKRDTEAIIECITSYCILNKIDLCEYIMQFYSDNEYLTNIFAGNKKVQEDKRRSIEK